MILYYTGTGNSKYAADFIGDRLGEGASSLFGRLKDKNYTPIESDKPFVICTPTYCWQIPHILRDWLERTELNGNDMIYFVMTCGGEVGNAEKQLKALCDKIGKKYMGCAEIVMPENYIAMFKSPDDEHAARIIADAESALTAAADRIMAQRALDEIKAGLIGRLCSSVVNDVFYPVFVRDKKFTVSAACTGCGLCERKCVMNNIKLSEGKPVWNGDCTHCMACISYCPTQAIEYGSHSKGLIRYKCREYNGEA